jgi:hypothetical protein
VKGVITMGEVPNYLDMLKMKDDKDFDGLTTIMVDASLGDETRQDAARALGKILDQRALLSLLEGLRSVNEDQKQVIETIKESLRNLHGSASSAYEELVEATRDKRWWVREQALLLLGSTPYKSHENTQLFIDALDDEHDRVRLMGVMILEGRVDVPSLVKALKHSSELVRWRAASALGSDYVRWNTRELSIPALQEALNDPSERVRKNVQKSLQLVLDFKKTADCR